MQINSPILDYRGEATDLAELRALRAKKRKTIICAVSALVLGVYLLASRVPITSRHPESQIVRAKMHLSLLKGSIDAFQIDNERYPTTTEGLQALAENPGNLPNWKGYVELVPNDPWGTPYIYRSPGTNGRAFDLISAGPDRQAGTADDVVLP
jgi:general secretion pathway protein G